MIQNVGGKVGGSLWRPIADLALCSAPRTTFNLLTRRASPLHYFSSPPVSPSPIIPRCTIRTQPRLSRNVSTGQTEDGVASLAAAAWRARGGRSRARLVGATAASLKARGRRYDSSKSTGQSAAKSSSDTTATPRTDLSPGKQIHESKETQPSTEHSILDRLPHFHRPSRDEVLAAATGFWSRMKARFKWFTIRSGRPYTVDEIYALFSWILVGHFLWILLGTTTFVSLLVLMLNTVFAQETLARWVGNYLTKSSGLKIVFESAIVPNWRSGVISFKKVFVSRRPGQGKANVSKGSAMSAAAAAAAVQSHSTSVEEEEDTNYTQFDVSIETVNVTLSFAKWWNGKGLLRDVEVKGVRGVVDRTSVHALAEPVDPKSYRHEHNTGDFELDSFKMEDLLVTIYQPNKFRPFTASIYSCDLPRLRKQWLFYDFLSANMISGSFDNSLFTIHPRQTHSYTGSQLVDGRDAGDGASQWKKHSRVRIDGLNIDHLNSGVEGPFGWIHEGNVDIVSDIMFPNDNDGSIAKVMSDFYDRVEATVTSSGNLLSGLQADDSHMEHFEEESSKPAENENDQRFVVMDLRVHMNDVRASVPLFTGDLSYVNNALVRPIVGYINSRKTFIPVNCRLVKPLSDFDGAWSTYDSGLLDDLSRETYEAFARDITDNDEARKRRFKKVGIWTLQLAAQALFIGLAGNVA